MKTFFLSLLFILSVFFSVAQAQKVTIYCRFAGAGRYWNVDYYNLGELLPDSVKAKVLVSHDKEYKLKNVNNLLLLMGMEGWKPVSIKFDDFVNIQGCLLSREIFLDEPALKIYMDKLKAVDK